MELIKTHLEAWQYIHLHLGDTACGAVFAGESDVAVVENSDGSFSPVDTSDQRANSLCDAMEENEVCRRQQAELYPQT